MNPKYSEYLDVVSSRLRKDKFEIQQGQQVGNYNLDLFAVRNFVGLSMAYRAFCGLSYSDGLDLEGVRTYSKTLFDFASEHVTDYTQVPVSYAVVVADHFPEESKAFVQTFDGAVMRFARRLRIEYPILIELSTSSFIYYQVKLGFVGYLAKNVARKVAKKYFAFNQESHPSTGEWIQKDLS
jgi:hypothetical protein